MKNFTQKSIRYVLTAAALLGMCQLFAPQASQLSPRIPSAMSWAGTKELAAGSPEAALCAIDRDPAPAAAADSLLRLFKLGAVNAALGNTGEAVAALNTVNSRSPLLAPLAMDLAGDVYVSLGEHKKAMDVYSTALTPAGLPAKYRQHIFVKVRSIVNSHGVSLPVNRNWIDDYRKWERTQRLFDATGLEAICDSLINADLIAEADSILEKHLPELGRRDACGIVERIFSKRSTDPKTTTKFLFTLASQANGCGNRATAERMLNAARSRPDFTKTVPARSALLLSANIAFGTSQWKKATELYSTFYTDHGADSDVLMNNARAHRNLNNQAEAQKWYDIHIKHFPTHTKSQEILWLRAWNLEESGQYKSAAAAYRRVFNTNGGRTEEAHVRHALCYYKQRDFDSVVIHLNTFQKKFPQSNLTWAGMFWQGKAHAALKRTEEAHKVWNSMARLDPTDYHAHRARQLMGVVDSFEVQLASPFASHVSDEQARAWLESVSPSSKKKLTAKDTVDLRRGAALLAIAQPEIADIFLGEYERNYSANLLLQFELASGYGIAGGPAVSFRVARRLAWRIPMGQREKMPLQVLSIIYPPFYAPMITQHATRFNVDPLFVSAVMRQESIFDYKIVSPAGAIGLMQIMPATGRDIAKELKEQYTPDSLYNPETNIKYGAYYLRKRLTMFKNDHVLALCSYNAGPNNAIKWRDRRKDPDDDIFAEDIGFKETRGYIKKVMGNYWTYQMLASVPGYDYYLPASSSDNYPWVNEW